MPRRRNLAILILCYGLVAAMILHQLGIDLGERGSDWRQGDWLINAHLVAVRRGLFGSGLLALADATGLPPLLLAFALPLGLMAALLVALVVLARAEGPDDRLLLILLSPGFVLFWGGDPEGALRKELLVHAAFLPLVFAAGRGGGAGPLAVTVGLYGLAAAGHELAAFFAPGLIAAILLCRRRDRASWSAAALVALLAGLALTQALAHPRLAEAGPVCTPLLQRGLPPTICEGAIDWLARDADYNAWKMAETMGLPFAWTAPLAYAAALAPFLAALWRSPEAGRGLALIVLAGLPFLPLWLVAIDWGRWINAHVAVLVFLALIALRRAAAAANSATAPEPLPRPVFALTLALCLLVGFTHVGARLRPGLVPTVAMVLR